MKFEWDEEKNQKNIEKHGIAFITATSVFDDPNRIEYYDVKHSSYEDRYITIGMVGDFISILTIVYTDRRNVIRIISARKATREEEKAYYDNI